MLWIKLFIKFDAFYPVFMFQHFQMINIIFQNFKFINSIMIPWNMVFLRHGSIKYHMRLKREKYVF